MTVQAPSLSRLLISHITLRGPEVKEVYRFIASRTLVSYQELAIRFVPSWQPGSAFMVEEAALREGLNFLLVAGLVQQHGDSRRKANFSALRPHDNGPFELQLIQAIRDQEDE